MKSSFGIICAFLLIVFVAHAFHAQQRAVLFRLQRKPLFIDGNDRGSGAMEDVTKEATTHLERTSMKNASKTKIFTQNPGSCGSSMCKQVMRIVQDIDKYRVFDDYDARLMFSDLDANSNKFYKLQLLQDVATGDFYVGTSWGRLGENGRNRLKGPYHDENKGIREFCSLFKSKTKNAWGNNDTFVRQEGKYQLVETTAAGDEESATSGALGRLTRAQIQKGQEVLKELRQVLECSSKKKDMSCIGNLSNQFYSLIPTRSGYKQRLPLLDNLEIVHEKESLLELWIQTGYQGLVDDILIASHIEGVFELPVANAHDVCSGSGITHSSVTLYSGTKVVGNLQRISP